MLETIIGGLLVGLIINQVRDIRSKKKQKEKEDLLNELEERMRKTKEEQNGDL